MAIITRSDWGAGPHKSSPIRLPVSRLFLHHTVTPEWIGVEAARKVHSIALQRGFLEISYSWLVDVQGNLIEGRGWGYSGAHTEGFNSFAHAISLVGNFEANDLPQAMRLGVAELVRQHGDFGPNQITDVHRNVSQTSCPGKYAIGAVHQINRLALAGPEEDEMLKNGDTGRYVKKMQEWLSTTGLALTNDGIFGKGTETAVKVFQRLTWLPVDGVYDSLVTAPQLAARVEAIRNETKPKFTREEINRAKELVSE